MRHQPHAHSRRWYYHASVCLLALTPSIARSQPAPTEAVIVAHPDDWQLFLGDRVIAALSSGARVQIAVLSAGGADRPSAYWEARERGAVRSMVTAVRLAHRVPDEREPLCGPWTLHGRVVHRCLYGPATTVFFRLPDGKPDGSGFPPTQQQSLAKLGSARERGIDAVDGSARWPDWPALARAVRAAISDDGRVRVARIHTHDPDRTINPVDHADHRATGLLALELARALSVPATVYQGYSIGQRADNLPDSAAAIKAALFIVYDRARMEANVKWSAYGDNPAAHAAYLWRTYGREGVP